MKKKLLFSYLLMLILAVFCIFSIEISTIAEEEGRTTKTDDNCYNYTTVNEEVTEITNSTKYIKNTGYCTRGGVKYEQTNNIMVADFNKGDEIKVVSWAVENSEHTGFVRQSIKSIGEDWEENHPGWVVLCGINADQYYMFYGTNLLDDSTDYVYNQPVYPLVVDNQNWFVISPYGETFNTVGFKNDGSTNPLVYGDRSVKGLYIHVYDENDNELGMFKATDLNIRTDLGANETTILAPYRDSENTFSQIKKTSSNDFYVVEDADLSIVSNTTDYAFYKGQYAVNAYFGKGKITKVSSSIDLKPSAFAIETRDEELKKVLKVGAYVKCQYEFDDGFAGITQSAGYHTLQRSHGVDQNVDNPYNTRPYPRSIVGCDAEGKIYLITNNGKNSVPTVGMYAQESNALMKQYGITDAFQMDGGGSVTCVIRNEKGELEFAMPSVEGDYRYDLTGLYIVMKVTNATITKEKVSQTEASFSCDLTKVEEDYSKAYLKVYPDNNKSDISYVEIKNGKANLTNLKSDTTYTYVLCFEDKDGNKKDTYTKSSFTTFKDYPILNSVKITKSGNKYIFNVNYDDYTDILLRINININGKDHYVKIVDGVGVLELEGELASILDMKIKFQCNQQNTSEWIDYDSYELDATVDVYLDHLSSLIDNFIDKLIK